VQWAESENAGFSRGKPWLGINCNYRYINYASQRNDPDSVLNFYKNIIILRKNNECLIYGEFLPLYADNRLMIYQRKFGNESYIIALNFSSHRVKISKMIKCFLHGTVCVSSSGRTALDGYLLPWEGVLTSEK
jgi:glycosidase